MLGQKGYHKPPVTWDLWLVYEIPRRQIQEQKEKEKMKYKLSWSWCIRSPFSNNYKTQNAETEY